MTNKQAKEVRIGDYVTCNYYYTLCNVTKNKKYKVIDIKKEPYDLGYVFYIIHKGKKKKMSDCFLQFPVMDLVNKINTGEKALESIKAEYINRVEIKNGKYILKEK